MSFPAHPLLYLSPFARIPYERFAFSALGRSGVMDEPRRVEAVDRSRLWPRALLAVTIASSVLFFWHAYIIDRLVTQPGFAPGWAWLIGGLGVAMPLMMMAERFVPPPGLRLLAWPASLWMGTAFELLVLLGLSDATLFVAERVAPGSTVEWMVPRAWAVLGTAALAVLWGIPAAMRPKTKRVTVSLTNWPSALNGFRIVQISDVHIGPTLGRRFARRIAEQVNALSPDLIAATGDLVDGPVQHLGRDTAPLAKLRAKHGVFFVTGNHDHYSGANPWCSHWTKLGWQVLRNEHRTINGSGGSFAIAGVDDYRGDPFDGEVGQDIPAALHGIPEHRPVVLLAHDPTSFAEASRHGVDLQLSGHTHGGQIWPFRYAVRVVVRWVAGLYRTGNSQLYVSRGTGFWGPPMRIGAPSEITEITLQRA
jgi:predicted MPP superfamily phosphohydrolase